MGPLLLEVIVTFSLIDLCLFLYSFYSEKNFISNFTVLEIEDVKFLYLKLWIYDVQVTGDSTHRYPIISDHIV